MTKGHYCREADGIAAVGHIDAAGQFVQTQSITGFSTNWTHIVFIIVFIPD